MKFGLRNIRALLSYLGNPEQSYPCVHVAGTNGKGSASSMIASILTASGYRTGLYTSPHLVQFNERVRIDGKPIPDTDLAVAAIKLAPMIKKTKATFFETTTAIALQHFKDKKVDIAILEAGLGGRFDATNIIRPLLTIITTIGLDHTEQLGSTYAKIAFEKGGTIKQGIPCITGVIHPDALAMLQKIARRKNSLVMHANDCSSVRIHQNSLSGLILDIRTLENFYQHLHLDLAGEYQTMNAQLALLAVEQLRSEHGFGRITKESIINGFAEVKKNSGLRGRLEVLSKEPLIIADVAHNPDGVKAVMSSLAKILVGRGIILFGVMKDKDIDAMVSQFRPLARLVVSVSPATDRALPSQSVKEAVHHQKLPVLDGKTVSGGMRLALGEIRRNEPLLILGSHYIVGEAIQSLKGNNVNFRIKT